MAEVGEIWSKVAGQSTELVVLSAEETNHRFGIPWEVLDAPGFIAEFGYTAAIDDVIHPSQLKVPAQTGSFDHWLRRSNWEGVLSGAKEELESVSESR